MQNVGGAKPKKSNLRWYVIGVLVILASGGGIYWFQKHKGLEVVYREDKVQKSTIEVTILSTGVVQPENRLEIKPPIAGRVERVLADEGDPIKKGQILAWMSSTERAALLDAARSKGAAELKRWEDLYQPTPILAPIQGSIIFRNVEPGQTFTGNDAVFVMSDRLTVKAQVDETDISQVKVGQKARIILDAYPEQKIMATVGKIAYDAKTVNNVTTYLVEVLPEQTPETMRSGMTANVTFFSASREDVLVVPSDALRVQDNKYFVLVKSAKNNQEKEVSIGLTDGKRTEILTGLAEGEVVLAAELSVPGDGKRRNANPFSPMGGMGGRGKKR